MMNGRASGLFAIKKIGEIKEENLFLGGDWIFPPQTGSSGKNPNVTNKAILVYSIFPTSILYCIPRRLKKVMQSFQLEILNPMGETEASTCF